jgi:hypothetical protein
VEAEPLADSVTDELADLLFALDGSSLRTSAMTSHITRVIVAWAVARGWSVRTEARVNVDHRLNTSVERLGFLDVVIRRTDAVSDIAIEIDSADKPWSVAKLQHAAAAGMHAIWVRWGDDEWAGVYQDIDVIQLRIARTPAHRDRSSQLSLWPLRPGRL